VVLLWKGNRVEKARRVNERSIKQYNQTFCYYIPLLAVAELLILIPLDVLLLAQSLPNLLL
jgi:hypothetical protein